MQSEGWQMYVESRTSSSRLARQDALRVGEDAVLERGVDHGLVLAVRSASSCRCGRQKPQFSLWYEVR